MVLFTDQSSATAPSVGSMVFVNVGAISQTAEIENLKVEQVGYSVGGTSYQIAAVIKNTGNGFIDPDLKLKIYKGTSLIEEIGETTEEESSGILPGTTRTFTFTYSEKMDLMSTYTAKLELTTPEGNMSKELEFYKPSASGRAPEDEESMSYAFLWLLIIPITGLAATIYFLRRKVKNYLSPNKVNEHPVIKPEVANHVTEIEKAADTSAQIELDDHNNILKPD